MQAAAKKAAVRAEEEKRSQRRWIMQYMEDQSEAEDEQEQVSAAGLSWAELAFLCAMADQLSRCSWPLMQALVYAIPPSLCGRLCHAEYRRLSPPQSLPV